MGIEFLIFNSALNALIFTVVLCLDVRFYDADQMVLIREYKRSISFILVNINYLFHEKYGRDYYSKKSKNLRLYTRKVKMKMLEITFKIV